MPASQTMRTNTTRSVSTDWQTFKTAQEAARTTLRAAVAALSPGGAGSLADAAFTTYKNSVSAAYEGMQTTTTLDLNKLMNTLAYSFDEIQAIIGSGLVSDVDAALELFFDAFDGSYDNGGGFENDVLANAEDQAQNFVASLCNLVVDPDTGASAHEVVPDARFVVTDLCLSVSEPSSATVTIPFADAKEDIVPAVAGLSTSSANADIGIGTRILLTMPGATGNLPILAGNVVRVLDDLGVDGTTVMLRDDKWRLQGVHVIGSFHWDPVNEVVTYRQRGPCRFNPNARPNCMDTPFGPMFAPYPDHGLRVDSPAPSPDERGYTDTTDSNGVILARFWRMNDILDYLRWATYGTDCLAYTGSFPWYVTLPDDTVYWPEGLGSAVLVDGVITTDDKAAEQGIKDNDREQGTVARMPDTTLEGFDLESAITKVVTQAGAYGLRMGALEDGRSVMSIVPTKYRKMHISPTAKSVIRYKGTRQKKNVPQLKQGIIEFDGSNAYTSVLVNADTVFLETRITFDPPSLTDRSTWTNESFLPAWSANEEQYARNYISQNTLYPNTPEAFYDMIAMFNKVFGAFRINTDVNFWASTKYANFPRVKAPPQILSHLLTWQAENGEWGALRRRNYLDISIEIKVDDDGDGVDDTWHCIGKADGLQSDEQGNILLIGPREAALQGQDRGCWKGSVYDAAGTVSASNKMLPRPIRLTVAILADHRMAQAIGFDTDEFSTASGSVDAFSDPMGLITIADPNGDRNWFERRLRRQLVVDTEAYREYLRRSAKPIPESIETGEDVVGVDAKRYLLGEIEDDDRDGSDVDHPPLLDESKFAKIHATRKFASFGRPQKSGNLVFDNFVFWEPGTIVTALRTIDDEDGEDDLMIESVVQTLRWSSEGQDTSMDLS